MKPILFDIAGNYVPAFFFLIMVGALVATFVMVHYTKKEGLSVVVTLDMAIIAVIMSIVGARIFHVLVEAPTYYWEDPIRVFYFWQGGFVSLGAFMASFFSWLLYLKWRKQPIWKYMDLAAASAPVIVFFVRLGCLFTGCCYGKPTHFFLHLTFTNPGSTAAIHHAGVPLHATQPYFMISAVILFILLWIIRRRKQFDGQLLSIFLIYYGVSRFFIEFLRGDADRGLYFNELISTGQIVMLLFIISGLVLYNIRRGRHGQT